MERTADRRGCTTFASVLSTAPSTLLSRNCRAISRNPSRPSIGARTSTFAIPTGFWGRFLGWIIVGSVRHHECAQQMVRADGHLVFLDLWSCLTKPPDTPPKISPGVLMPSGGVRELPR